MTRRRLVVHHATTYRYREPVAFGEHRMMFRPRASHDLSLLETRLEIRPEPSALRWIHDEFDNSVVVASFDAKAAELHFESSLTLEHFEVALPDYALESRARTFPFAYSGEELSNLGEARRRRHADPAVEAWITQFLGADGGADTFFLDAGNSRPTWDTLVNFHPRDMLTIWDFMQGVGTTKWLADGAGASGYQGATLQINAGAGSSPNELVTFAGLSTQTAQFDLTSGTTGGLDYLAVTRVS